MFKPQNSEFTLVVRNIWPGCQEIEIEGELDLAVSEQLQSALEGAMTGRLHVLIDLSRCEFIDVSGVTVLLHAHQRLANRHRQLLLFGVHGQVRKMLSLTGLAGADHGTATLAVPRRQLAGAAS